MAKAKTELVLVDQSKVARAEEIVALLGGKTPKTDAEQALRARFAELVKEEDVAKEDYLEFVYTKLGGLVRTEEEEKVAKVKEKAAKKAFKAKKTKADDDDEAGEGEDTTPGDEEAE